MCGSRLFVRDVGRAAGTSNVFVGVVWRLVGGSGGGRVIWSAVAVSHVIVGVVGRAAGASDIFIGGMRRAVGGRRVVGVVGRAGGPTRVVVFGTW